MAELQRATEIPPEPRVQLRMGNGFVSTALSIGQRLADIFSGGPEDVLVVVVGKPNGQWRGEEPFQVYLTASDRFTSGMLTQYALRVLVDAATPDPRRGAPTN